MNNIGLFIAALMGWQRGREFLAEVDERYIRTFRFIVIATIFGYTAFCGYAAYHQWHGVAAIGYIVVVLLGGLYISLSWQGLTAIAGLSAATRSLTPLRAIGYLALVFAIPTAMSEALMLGAINKPHMLFPLYVAGTIFGIYSLLWGGNVWFKRVVVISAAFLAGKAIVGMYVEQTATEKVAEKLLAQNEEQLDKNDATYLAKKGGFADKAAKGELTDEQKRQLAFAVNGEPVHKRVVSYVEERLGVVTVEYQVPSNIAPENLKPICGIPPGEYMFDISGDAYLMKVAHDPVSGDSRQNINIKDWGKAGRTTWYPEYIPYGMMLNNAPIGKTVVVGETGCVKPFFNLNEKVAGYFRDGTFEIEQSAIRIVLK